MNGILNEIASVALLPRNDGENSRIPSIRDPRVKPEDDTKQPEDDTNDINAKSP
ncbi:hypothetical protein PTQ35_00620 [Campylobacter sp. 46490-21]|uniref:hypothetical protein n=1 Tax=Campylobacter magnus TaxID=3026462 RepID=UPI002362ED7E|nr:hypothetical protein [Campylobacter magnus]MDD0847316.1 hypothetical protein [Campylobacter magnus]